MAPPGFLGPDQVGVGVRKSIGPLVSVDVLFSAYPNGFSYPPVGGIGLLDEDIGIRPIRGMVQFGDVVRDRRFVVYSRGRATF